MSANIYDMTDFMISKEIIRDVPKIIRLLDTYYNQLWNYQHYKDVGVVMDSILEAQMSLGLHYEFYSKIHSSKGKVDE